MNDRRTGKIARLPFAIRTQVNERMRDGEPYGSIMAWLSEQGIAGVTDQNLTNWKAGGHLDWLKEQERLADMANKREFALEIVRQNEGSKLHEATLHLAASQIYEALSEFDLSALKDLLREKPENYAAIVNGIAKLSKGALDVEKYKEQVRAQKEKILDATRAASKGGLTPETLKQIEEAAALL